MFKNVASQKLTVLAFADAGHATLDAGERVTGDAANITLKIEQDDDGTQSASNDTNPTEVEDGQYVFDLTQAETNGDKLTFYPESSTAGVQVVALPSLVIYTRPQYFADIGIESDGHVHADVKQIEGSDATDQIRDAVVDDATRIDASALNTASTAIGSDGTGLTEAGGTGDHLTGVPWNASWDAEVQSECNDALVALGLDHLVSTAVVGADIANNSVFARLVSSSATADWDDFANTTDSLQALRDHIGDGTNLTEAGGTGDHLTAVPWNASWDAEVQSECTDALNAYDPPTKAELDTGFAALNDPTAAAIATEILAAGDVDGYSIEETLKLCLAALAGKLSGAAGTTVTIRSADDSANRIVATVDSNGNRTAVTLDATG